MSDKTKLDPVDGKDAEWLEAHANALDDLTKGGDPTAEAWNEDAKVLRRMAARIKEHDVSARLKTLEEILFIAASPFTVAAAAIAGPFYSDDDRKRALAYLTSQGEAFNKILKSAEIGLPPVLTEGEILTAHDSAWLRSYAEGMREWIKNGGMIDPDDFEEDPEMLDELAKRIDSVRMALRIGLENRALACAVLGALHTVRTGEPGDSHDTYELSDEMVANKALKAIIPVLRAMVSARAPLFDLLKAIQGGA